jgi:3-dehydrosphinganine reductase
LNHLPEASGAGVSDRRGVIVTGGSSGIGLATARLYAARGFHVGLVARTGDKLEKAADEVRFSRSEPETIVSARVADLRDADATRRAIEGVLDDGVTPDIVVNSAGVIVPGEFVAMSPEDFASNIDSGFWSVVHPCRVLAPMMIERGSGHIVNVSSVAGFLGVYGYTSYAAAKYAVMGFTEALRFEMKPHGVAVSVVCPPDTNTPALERERQLRPPETDAIAGTIKPIQSERVAEAILTGVDRGKYYIIPGFESRIFFRLKGLLPEVFFRIVDKDVRKVRSGR